MKAINSIIFSIIISIKLFSQGSNDNLLPDITPPSPQAANFLRYGEVPVDLSTGVPNISIPLYTIEEKDLKLPISISYHASGIKVQDIASCIGLGWVLNAGGIVSRSINSLPDENILVKEIKTSAELDALIPQDDYESNTTLYELAHNAQDMMSDRFSYSINGISGICRYDFITDEFKNVPFSPVKVDWIYNNASDNYFKITDENGITYYFEKIERVLRDIEYKPSSWHITKIISPRGEIIRFYYSSVLCKDIISRFSTLENGPDIYWNVGVCVTPKLLGIRYRDGLYNDNHAHQVNDVVELDSIVSSNSVIIFEKFQDRQDLGSFRMDNIKILSRNNGRIKIKEIKFITDYTVLSSDVYGKRLFLYEMRVSGSDPANYQSYHFEYNDLHLPRYHDMDPHLTYHEDFWGYYNGRSDTYSTPQQYFPISYYSGGWWEICDPTCSQKLLSSDRTANETYMKADILEKIIYPTGGITEFEFEANKVVGGYDYTSETTFGGLRIKSIKNYTSAEDAEPEIKTYKYGINEDGYGKRFIRITKEIFCFEKTYSYKYQYIPPEGQQPCMVVNFESTPHNFISSFPSSPLTVTNGAPVIYEYVTEYLGTVTNNSGKAVSIYKMPPDETQLDDIFLSFHNKVAYHWDRGNYEPKLIKKDIFVKGSTTPIHSTSYEYTPYNSGEFNTGLSYQKNNIIYDQNEGSFVFNKMEYERYNNYSAFFVYHDTKAFTEVEKLYRITEVTDGVTKTTLNYYNNANYLSLSKSEFTTSKGGTDYITYKYPFDYSSSSPYDEMVTRNQIAPVIESSEYKNGSHFQTIRNSYEHFGSLTLPTLTMVKKGTQSTFDEGVDYISYDGYGNITSLSKLNDIPTCYIWGYNNTLPVAKVVGATYSEVANALGYGLFIINTGTYSDSQLRSYLSPLYTSNYTSGAHVYTYTYKPLVGITSETDPNGITTYYEYDNFGRLYRVLDQNLKEIKKYIYHYKE